MVPKNSKPGVVCCRSARAALPPQHTHNPLLVKEKVPTFVRIPGIDGASRVTCTVRGPGHHARMLAEAAAGFRVGKVF